MVKPITNRNRRLVHVHFLPAVERGSRRTLFRFCFSGLRLIDLFLDPRQHVSVHFIFACFLLLVLAGVLFPHVLQEYAGTEANQ